MSNVPNRTEKIKTLADDVQGLTKTVKSLTETVGSLAEPVHNKAQGLFGISRGPLAKDSKQYSFMALAKALQTNNWEHAKFEKSIHDQLMSSGYARTNGFLTPMDPAAIESFDPVKFKGLTEQVRLTDAASQPDAYRSMQKALSAFGTDIDGGALMSPTMANSVIELLRANVVVEKAGATSMQLPPSGQMSWARQTFDPSFSWVGENTAPASSQPGFGSINFSAKKAMALVYLSNDALLYTNPAVEILVRQSLAAKGARFEDQAFLEGLGGSFSPLGIINEPGIQTQVAGLVGNNGDTFQSEDLLKMEALVEEANDPDGLSAYIMRPLMWAALANRRADSVSSNDGKGPFMFWTTRGDMTANIPKTLNGRPVYTTTSLSNTRAKGSATNLSYILGGNFKRAIIARSAAMEISALSSGEEFKADQTVLKAVMRLDFGLTHTKPFVLCDTLVVG